MHSSLIFHYHRVQSVHRSSPGVLSNILRTLLLITQLHSRTPQAIRFASTSYLGHLSALSCLEWLDLGFLTAQEEEGPVGIRLFGLPHLLFCFQKR